MRERFKNEKCMSTGNGRLCGGKFEENEDHYENENQLLADWKKIEQGEKLGHTPCGLCISKMMHAKGITPKPMLEMNFETGEVSGELAKDGVTVNGKSPQEFMMRERNKTPAQEMHLDLFGKKFCDGNEFTDEPHTKFPKEFVNSGNYCGVCAEKLMTTPLGGQR